MKTIFTFFLVWTLSLPCTAQWVELDSGVNVPYFSDVYAITPDIVVVVGANGTILKTTDGGETWAQKPSGTTENLRKVQFATPDIGYAISAGDAFLKTTDGGETWGFIDAGSNCFYYGFSCVDANLIFATCSGNLIKSEDAGNTWETIAPLTGGGELLFLNNQIGFAWDNPASFFSKTENGGETWIEIGGISPIDFIDENTGFFYESGLYKTTNGGNNFDLACIGSWFELKDIYAVNENNIWGIFAGTLDGDPSSRGITKITSLDSNTYSESVTWENNINIDMHSIHFSDEFTGYIVGEKNNIGTIWKNGTGINIMNTAENNFSDNIKVYPNPASSEINIVLDNSTLENYSVSLTDSSGKQVFIQNYLNQNKISINVHSFPKGTYILKVNNFTKKIIIN